MIAFFPICFTFSPAHRDRITTLSAGSCLKRFDGGNKGVFVSSACASNMRMVPSTYYWTYGSTYLVCGRRRSDRGVSGAQLRAFLPDVLHPAHYCTVMFTLIASHVCVPESSSPSFQADWSTRRLAASQRSSEFRDHPGPIYLSLASHLLTHLDTTPFTSTVLMSLAPSVHYDAQNYDDAVLRCSTCL